MGNELCLEDFENPWTEPDIFDDWAIYRNVSMHWTLVEEYAVDDAVLLILGIEPQAARQKIGSSHGSQLPTGYDAMLAALRAGLKCKKIKGYIVPRVQQDFNGNVFEVPDSMDASASWVSRDSLTKWLQEAGYADCPFFQLRSRKSGFSDPGHPRYSAKLDAVVQAWHAFDESSSQPGTPKQRLTMWLRLNAERFGLVNADGKPSENVIEELAKVANWATAGGAPKQSSIEPEPEDIPF